MLAVSLLVREGNTTDTLKGIIGLVTKEVCRRVLYRNVSKAHSYRNTSQVAYLHDLEGLDLASVLDVRSSAKVNQGTASVHGALFARNELIDVVQLVFAVRKHFAEILLGNFQAIEALLVLEDPLDFLLKRRPVRLNDNAAVLTKISHSNLTNNILKQLCHQQRTYPAWPYHRRNPGE